MVPVILGNPHIEFREIPYDTVGRKDMACYSLPRRNLGGSQNEGSFLGVPIVRITIYVRVYFKVPLLMETVSCSSCTWRLRPEQDLNSLLTVGPAENMISVYSEMIASPEQKHHLMGTLLFFPILQFEDVGCGPFLGLVLKVRARMAGGMILLRADSTCSIISMFVAAVVVVIVAWTFWLAASSLHFATN